MATPEDSALTELIAAIKQSAKYRDVSPDLISRIGREELAKGRRLKDAIKETKDRLHQVGGAFLDVAMPYSLWLQEIEAAPKATLRDTLLGIMRHHASTRERLPFLSDFYAAAFAGMESVTSALDLACGLHPLGIPWMPLATGVTYHAYDIYAGMIALLNGAWPRLGVTGQAQVADLTQLIPTQPVDIAFALKTLPTLDQIDPAAPRRLLDSIRARRIVVSYPARSLGGKSKGMVGQYEAQFARLVAGKDWRVERVLFPTELVFVIDTV